MSNTSRCALVTGASSGIGRSTAIALAEADYAVAVAARRREPLDELVAEIESSAGKAVAITADLTKPDDIRRVWTDATEKLGGPIDCLIANAGRGLQGGVTTSDDTQWRQMVELNLTGTMDLMRLAAESMRTGTGVRDI
ncbi:MAG: SDR family NAD(P)-dependent oxidoreductase, partial [Planctomycetota bacterium]